MFFFIRFVKNYFLNFSYKFKRTVRLLTFRKCTNRTQKNSILNIFYQNRKTYKKLDTFEQIETHN